MALEFFDGRLTGDFEKFYIDLLNCDFVVPPYRDNKYRDYVFLTKRKGINKKYDIAGYDITDIVTIPEGVYLLAIKQDRSKVRIYKEVNNGLVLLFETDFKKGNYERFIKFDFVKGRPRKLFKNDTNNFPNYTRTTESGKQVEDDTNEPHHYLTDTDNTNDFNTSSDDSENGIYGGDYLYVYDYKNSPPEDNDGIAGQVNEIVSVDNTSSPKKIAVEYPWLLGGNNEGDDMKYAIFPERGQIFGFVGKDAIYTWHYDENTNDTTIILRNGQTSPGKNVGISSVTIHKGTLNFITDKGRIFTGRQGYLKLYYSAVDYVDVGSGYDSLASFQDYVLVMGRKAMMLMTITYDKENGVYVQQTYDLSSSIGLYDKYSFLNANENFYFISSTRDFYGLSITPAGYDKYVPKYERQSFYITGWLDKLQYTNINIQKSNTKIYLFVNVSGGTHIFVFDFFYGKWLHWELQQEHIFNYDDNTGYFYGTNVYNLSSARKDLESINYTQAIHWIFGEPTLATLKNINILKLIIGKNSKINKTDTILNLVFHYGGYKIKYVLDRLNRVDFFENVQIMDNGSTLGNSLLGDVVLGSGDGSISVSSSLGDIGVVKINIGQLCHLFEGKIEAKGDNYIEFGGFLLGYKKLNPTIENIGNVYTT